jgi:hypothetical protein
VSWRHPRPQRKLPGWQKKALADHRKAERAALLAYETAVHEATKKHEAALEEADRLYRAAELANRSAGGAR